MKSQEKFDLVYKAIFGSQPNRPIIKYKDPDRWMDTR